jgi:hypothetical protein
MRRVFLILLVVLSGGCMGYQLGPTNGMTPGLRTVKFAPFVNKTHEPRVTEYFSTSLRKLLQQDGTYALETSGSPDILVKGEITRFDRSGLSYDPNDVLTPQEYTLTMQIHITAIKTSTGKAFIDRTIRGHTYIRIFSDEFSNERQAIPLLTDDLARNAVSLLVDGSW